jgi:hypothetical protein
VNPSDLDQRKRSHSDEEPKKNPCLKGSLNCVTNTSTDQVGIVSGYTSTTGYDLAIGLGSVNTYNLVNAWFGDLAPKQDMAKSGATDAAACVFSERERRRSPGRSGAEILRPR